MHILIATDGKPCSQLAVEAAKASYPSAHFTVVSLSARPTGNLVGLGEALGAVVVDKDHEDHQANAALAGAKLTFGETPEVTYRIVRGDPGESIVRTAREVSADVIVVGSHGQSTLERLVVGSVAHHVVSHAPCSVLVVKDKPITRRKSAASTAEWTV